MLKSSVPENFPIDAVLFDMDGVVTDTARIHFEAWKSAFDRFLETFSANGEQSAFTLAEYRQHVDGKSRMDGIAAFLKGRGFAFDQSTVDRLARRKNRAFHARLEADGVETYPGTLRLIEGLRERGLPYAIFTASRNAEAVLENAGVRELFDVLVDGNVAADLNLAGKPAPDVLLETARRIGADPARTAVLEDAVAGVQAAHRGGFRPVIGIARGASRETYRDEGADIVVEDACELALTAPSPTTVAISVRALSESSHA